MPRPHAASPTSASAWANWSASSGSDKRREPARDSGLSANINVGCAGPIASRLAPTGFVWCQGLSQ
ncbi:hypothetical protein C1X34_32125 [Pseudomonas sp. GW456-12-10-14-TSB6]|nr:hypothetical protein [Pseudomonas mandelii]PMV80758.1 hypothetical protein C1X56_30620 [Pseudomonas sp. GW101-1A09]PMV87662.1 hypothetical protein C1X51_27460 [Pseudomonas sp. FW306-2-2C-B10A]PMV97950.1 hypothetical protein C1X55_15430 [Pseudomonas sp. GW460-C8]PMW03982.1 hypothetical protein C1X50_20135 [Pseudomonas sp. MPR-TSA4]PMW08924.1 hypothetical protein C1X52_27465 [Pseudomonas sp. FW306-2-1A-C05A]PMW16232.1 hypothetical protein C1X40_19430 [Pseudomonas sp. GW456-11-11-14-TSB2]PMW